MAQHKHVSSKPDTGNAQQSAVSEKRPTKKQAAPDTQKNPLFEPNSLNDMPLDEIDARMQSIGCEHVEQQPEQVSQ